MPVNIQTIKDIRKFIKAELSPLYPETEIDSLSDIIMKTLFGTGRLHFLSNPAMVVPEEKQERIKEVIAELKVGRPIQYIFGITSFYNCIIRVNEHTLIPRQETEELVDLIIKENADYKGDIIDIGTGSGCIAVALAKNMPGARVTGIDVSSEALETARLNAESNSVSVDFIQSDILVPGKITCKPAGIVVSNPPYVRESEKELMHRNVLEHEPQRALFVPDNDPLLFYRAILEASDVFVEAGGKIYFEINEALGNEVIALTKSSGFGSVATVRDLNGKERFVKGIRNG